MRIDKFVSSSPEIFRITLDPEVEAKQIKRLDETRKSRNNSEVIHSLRRLEEVVRSDENTIPILLECADSTPQ